MRLLAFGHDGAKRGIDSFFGQLHYMIHTKVKLR
jgi:hypothetical protein